MLAHVPSFGRNPRGSPDFPAYPVPKACMHVPGTRVPRRLGVARSASSPKAAQALGCSLTPGLRISFGRVTCMARAASVPGLWALGFLLLCGVCVWVRLAVGCGFCQPRLSWLGFRVGVFGLDLWCCPPSVGYLWCSWLGFGFGLLLGRVWFRGRPACPPPFPVPARGVGVCAGPGSRLCPVRLGWVVGVCFFFFLLWFFLFFFFFCFWALWSLSLHPLSFGLGWWLSFFFFFFFFFFFCPFSPWSAVTGLVLPVLGGWFACASAGVPLFFFFFFFSGGGAWPPVVVLAGGWAAVGCFRAFSPSPLLFFFFGGGGLPVPPSAFPGLAHALACIQCCLPGCCFQLGSVWPCSGPMGRVGSVHCGLGAPSCWVRSWLCRLGGCARRLLVVLG